MNKQDIYDFSKYILLSECKNTDEEIIEKFNYYINYLKSTTNLLSDTETLNVLFKIRDNIPLIIQTIKVLGNTSVFDELLKNYIEIEKLKKLGKNDQKSFSYNINTNKEDACGSQSFITHSCGNVLDDSDYIETDSCGNSFVRKRC